MLVFSVKFDRYLTRRELSSAEFGRRVGLSSGHINNVRHGRRPPPLEGLDQWIEVLNLDPIEKAQFIRLARLLHCPPQVQSLVAEIERKLEIIEDKNARNTKRVAHLESLMRAAGITIPDEPAPTDAP
jgi:transcriptional regulator with XRE-family HTH domain